MLTLRNCARAGMVLLGALLLNLYGGLWTSTAAASGIVAQAQTNPGPLAPPFVFFLLFLGIFVAVLAFSFMAFRDVNR